MGLRRGPSAAHYLGIFESGLAFIQNWSDLPQGIKVRDNTPEDIRALTAEALGMPVAISAAELEGARAGYRRIAEANHSYVGSTIAASFIDRHREVFNPATGVDANALGEKGEGEVVGQLEAH